MQLSRLTTLALLALAAISFNCRADNPRLPRDWKTLDSHTLSQNKAWETSNWNDFHIGESLSPDFVMSYPEDWKFNGHSVFEVEPDVKIAELSPGVVIVRGHQRCPLSARKSAPIRVGQLRGKKSVVEFEDDFTHSKWHRYGYCLSDGRFTFLVAFFSKAPDKVKKQLFDRVVSTFRFTEPAPAQRAAP